MADGRNINPSSNVASAVPTTDGEGENMAKGPLLAVDPIVAMENGKAPTVMENGTVDSGSLTSAHAGAKVGDFAAAVDLKEHTVSVDFALCVSVLYAVLTSLALWPVADRPRSVVWVFSIITSAYLVLWTTILTKTMRARTVFVSVSYIALVAATVAHLSSRIGMVVMHLDTAYAAGLFGYALAEHRQFVGVEKSATTVPMPSSLREEELKKDRDNCTLMSFFAAVVSLMCTVCAACVLCYTKDTYWLIVEMSYLIDLSLFCWTCILTLQILHGVFVEAIHMSVTYLIGPASLLLLEILVSYLFGKAIGTLVHSLGMMGMAGLFGYSLGIYAHYKHLVTLEVSTEVSKLPLVQASNEKLPKQEV